MQVIFLHEVVYDTQLTWSPVGPQPCSSDLSIRCSRRTLNLSTTSWMENSPCCLLSLVLTFTVLFVISFSPTTVISTEMLFVAFYNSLTSVLSAFDCLFVSMKCQISQHFGNLPILTENRRNLSNLFVTLEDWLQMQGDFIYNPLFYLCLKKMAPGFPK